MALKVIGEGAALVELSTISNRFNRGLKEAACDAGDVLVRTAHQGMDGAHSPAGPGGYPANVTGNLRAGVQYLATPYALYFKSRAPHSHFLEDGTVKMEARPVIINAVRDAKPEVDIILRNKPFKRLK